MIELVRSTIAERAEAYKQERAARVEQTWNRFRDVMWASCGQLVPDHDDLQKRLGVMRHRLRQGPLPGFKFDTMLAAEDVGGLDHLAELVETEPTNAPPGTRRKVEVLAARAAAGEELWHPEDAATFSPL